MNTFKTLKDYVYNYIAEQLTQGNLKPGDKISENTICNELNISRTPVREALILLSSEGIIENMARRGFVVKAVTEKDARELYVLIGILDGSAAKLACDHLTEQDLSDMEFYIASIDLAIQVGNMEMYHKQQYIFHQIYLDKCDNNLMIDSLEKLKNKLLRRGYNGDQREQVLEIFRESNEQHREILRLFQEKDKDGLFNFISETHWTSIYAKYDVIT